MRFERTRIRCVPLGLISLGLATACGVPVEEGASPGVEDEARGSESVTSGRGRSSPELTVTVVAGSGSRLTLPDPSLPVGLRQHRAGDVFSFEEIIQMGWDRDTETSGPTARLRRLRPLFFVLRAGTAESPIRDLRFSHRVYDSRNRAAGTEERRPGRRDPERDLWYLPLSELTDASPDPEAARRHELWVEILRANGVSETVRILFRIAVPGLRSLRREDVAPIRPEDHGIRPPAPETLWIASERLTHVGSEPTRIRLELEVDVRFRQWGFIPRHSGVYYDHSGRPFGFPSSYERFEAVREFDRRGVWVTRSGARRPERLDLSSGAGLEIAPGENVELHWWIGLDEDLARCDLPQGVNEVPWAECLHWSLDIIVQCLHWRPIQRRERFPVQGRLAASGAEGTWVRRWFVEPEDASPGLAEAHEQAAREDQGAKIPDPPSSLPVEPASHSCAGLY